MRPLVVDLDGTLIHTDMLHESALKAFRDTPWIAMLIPVWLLEGKAALKEKLARRNPFNPEILPYNQGLIRWLRKQKKTGRPLVLCTASDRSVADAIASHLGLFDEVMASDGVVNLSGQQKAESLIQRFGKGGYDYAGNSAKDLPVWAGARQAVVVNANRGVTRKAHQCSSVEKVFVHPARGPANWLKMLRAHHWLKNLLLFMPLIAAHELHRSDAIGSLVLAFLAFSLCASSVYILNDLLDLESDRLHPRKRRRPFAAGAIDAWQGVMLVPLLLLASVALASAVGTSFVQWLGVYFIMTCAYSFGLKRLMLVDCLALAMLYTLRIVAGAAASNNELTFWLLAESVFLFLSLAFVKRYAELKLQAGAGEQRAHGRGYVIADAPLIQTLGVTSGYIAVLVLALYFNSDTVIELYRYNEIVWIALPFMLFWISWMWLQANRGQMHDDPLVFAVKDKASLAAGVGFAAVLVLATVGLPW
ncbi:UbiA family prenyltransferase [Pseudohongiella spirulinae]|uniref:UbiA prenyltransferase n=1 Tax=Pseudohongiella spirulinae TaxID=1249552 RepID=A0A0S2KGV7_9GAMM|nr:UbiA family prenyltransferase [Pseudohongiella spirulinae]ALO47186.1 UbiA prenyltransferase [Pseudohongiella spirulinae]